ncbi:glycosyltransferase family 1 protein [Paenirhodobacter sp. CAU 1674]|uniref:glycosyltransferase family 4 protein n=1 Tax=Paenirhodobacter sp. CAU 1674 TaxID=3032596 RepID=UPI0023DAC546|nr:glycosyltransferase family 1 protein [Paenirhodobacter sp. CAU 1674]MDF2140334.1 glycosyltransferase family 1 protein [Paenirhodobacter sp. CAU 1674]
MRPEPAARLLDVTRLVSRVGLGPLTGVDRVEAAYLDHLRHEPVPLYLLCRTGYGYLLLRGAEAEFLFAALSAPETLPCAGWFDRLRGRRGLRTRLEAGLRARAIARAGHRALTRLIARHLPTPARYINVGQTTLRPETLRRLKRVPGLRITAMLHDTIPLDFPQFAREGEPERFAASFAATLGNADLILANSAATAADLARHAARLGLPLPPVLVAHLGITTAPPDPAQIPGDLDLLPGYFVTLGTIEPRKNHALLLDVWDRMSTEMPEDQIPRLLVLGRRGWRNEAVFARLDQAIAQGCVVQERADLPDAAVSALLARAQALLMPSFAEGFGLPVLEAAALGTPVVASPLPATQELLGNSAIYANPDAPYDWLQIIKKLTGGTAATDEAIRTEYTKIIIPTWTEHFNIVLKKT